MIAIPGNVRVWLATGHTDMRRGFRSLALMVQEELKRDPHCGDLYVFRGRRGRPFASPCRNAQPRMPIMSSKNDRLYEAELKTGAMCVPMVHSSQQARMA
jgi:hypothetical protein